MPSHCPTENDPGDGILDGSRAVGVPLRVDRLEGGPGGRVLGAGLRVDEGEGLDPLGAVSAARRERKPPWDMPTRAACSIPRWSSKPSTSAAESQQVKGPPAGVCPKPRWSHVITRKSPLRPLIWGANISWSIKNPWLSTTAGSLPPVSSK